MGNLLSTIQSFQILLQSEHTEKNTLLFVTTNGLYVGTVVRLSKNHLDIDNPKIDDPNDYYVMSYCIANGYTLESQKDDEDRKLLENLNLKETILLKDVKLKTGNIVLNLPYTVLNLSQIISVQFGADDQMRKLLDSD